MSDTPRLPSDAVAPASVTRGRPAQTAPLVTFVGIMLALAVLAVGSIVFPRSRIAGLPEDADVRAAADLLRGRVRVDAGDLRFAASILGGEETGRRFTAAHEPAVGRAEALLRRAGGRIGADPRLVAATACLDLVRRDARVAEQGYRAALDWGRYYSEARLGLGIAYALQAENEPEPMAQRGMLLRSIAQLAAVEREDPEYSIALYDRALLLERVGRREEAARVAAEYLARDPASAWSEHLRSALGERGGVSAPR
jgi:hypothetical protein